MKAFEAWREKNVVSGRSYRADARVWRAALEEVLRVIVEDSDGPSNPKDLMEWLHEELEEDNGVDEALRKQHEEWKEEQDIQNDIADGIQEELGEIAHPICPLNLYWEGDEDECDASKCDFENRTCSRACTDMSGRKK